MWPMNDQRQFAAALRAGESTELVGDGLDVATIVLPRVNKDLEVASALGVEVLGSLGMPLIGMQLVWGNVVLKRIHHSVVAILIAVVVVQGYPELLYVLRRDGALS